MAEIDLLSPKQNGRAVDSPDPDKQAKTGIRGMWKRAFKSVKTKDKEEKPEHSRDREKEKDPETDKSWERERTESTGEYDRADGPARQTSRLSRQSSLKRILRKKESLEEEEGEGTGRTADPVYMALKEGCSRRKGTKSDSTSVGSPATAYTGPPDYSTQYPDDGINYDYFDQ